MVVLILGVVAAIIVPNFIRARAQNGSYCRSNIKNIASALEMYSSEHDGQYPRNLQQLTPEYLRSLPECPVAERNTYRATFGPNAPWNIDHEPDFYLLECMGTAHSIVGVPADYPKFNSVSGLIER